MGDPSISEARKRANRTPRAGVLLLTLSLFEAAAHAAPPASGPLKRLESNPRYFTDGSQRAILLVGSHNWHNFQDNGHRLNGSADPPPRFDFEAYLDFLERHGHNFFRLWRWEAPKWTDAQPAGMIKYCEPHPWRRSGAGTAADGKPKFDLDSFEPTYFDRMHLQRPFCRTIARRRGGSARGAVRLG